MAKVTFVGDARGHGPVVMRAYGCLMPKGEPVEVTDEHALAKFRGNSHYEVDDSEDAAGVIREPGTGGETPPPPEKKPARPRKPRAPKAPTTEAEGG